MDRTPEFSVHEEPDAQRFVVHVDGAPAGAAYTRRVGSSVVFTHTEVDDAFAGKGVGRALVAAALATVRARGERIVPLCPFVARYVDEHPEDADLVDVELTAQLRGRG